MFLNSASSSSVAGLLERNRRSRINKRRRRDGETSKAANDETSAVSTQELNPETVNISKCLSFLQAWRDRSTVVGSNRYASIVPGKEDRVLCPSFVDVVGWRLCRRLALIPASQQPRSTHRKGTAVACLDIDEACEERFLLSGGTDTTVAVHDLASSSSSVVATSTPTRANRFAFAEGDGSGGGHASSVCSVQWYPVDTGLFVSADRGGRVILWDTNRFVPALSFVAGAGTGLNTVMMPRSAESPHFLAAVCGSGAGDVQLADVTSGSSTHRLVGHGGTVYAAAWNPASGGGSRAYELATVGADGTVRLWDIRRSGSRACLHVLDREDVLLPTTAGRAVPSSSLSLRCGPNDFSAVQQGTGRALSHGGPVMALVYSHDGRYLVTAAGGRASDRFRLWDLDGGGGTVVPKASSVWYGGSTSSSSSCVVSRTKKTTATVTTKSNHRPILCLTQPGGQQTATLWCNDGRDGTGDLLAYPLHQGGSLPSVRLQGHFDTVSSVVAQTHRLRLYTGSADGMILGWGGSDGNANGNKNSFLIDEPDADTWDNDC